MSLPPCELYRLYDVDDRLLYVGVSINIRERLLKHSYNPPYGKAWWPDVAYCTLEWFEASGWALIAEVRAIKTERPVYNIRSAVA